MKRFSFYILLVLLSFPHLSSAATYTWNTYTAGNLNYANGNMNVSITGTAFDTRGPQDPNGGTSNGYKSPKYVSSATINTFQAGNTDDYGMQGLVIGHDWTNLTTSTSVIITFTVPVSGPVTFDLYDINTGSWGGNNPVWIDKITIAGTNCAGVAVYPVITGCANNISGTNSNVITGNGNCTNSTNTVTFNTGAIKTITITYASGSPLSSGYGSDPDPQYIIVSDITTSAALLLTLANNAPVITCASSTVTLSATSSATNAAYSWTGPNSGNPAGTTPNSSSTAISAAGTYTVTMTDATSGCSASASVSVTANTSGVSASTAFTNAACGSNNGTATATGTGGTGTYAYLWNNSETAASISNLSAGIYTVTVSSNTCSATASVIVGTTPNLSLTVSATDASCGQNNGQASVIANGGTGSFLYHWSNADSVSALSNLSSGIYSVTVTSSTCAASTSVTIGNTDAITLTSTFTGTTCGNNNGSATIDVAGGTGLYIYHWNNSAAGSSLSNLSPGGYAVTVMDNTGCSATASGVIHTSGTGTVHITPTHSIMCAGDSVLLCADNSYPSYHWNTGAISKCIYVKTAGNYYVTITDDGNCTVASNHVTINTFPLPPVSVSVNGDTMTSFDAVGYQWYFNGNRIEGAIGNIYIAPQAGNYAVLITDSNNCHVFSNPLTIGTVGINETSASETFQVYPNPLFNGNWVLRVDGSLVGADMEILDADGRLINKSEIRNTNTEIDMTASRGIYFLRLHSAKGILVRKLIHL